MFKKLCTLNNRISLNCISFGFDADFEFLQDLDSEIAKRIAESENAAEELTGFPQRDSYSSFSSSGSDLSSLYRGRSNIS